MPLPSRRLRDSALEVSVAGLGCSFEIEAEVTQLDDVARLDQVAPRPRA